MSMDIRNDPCAGESGCDRRVRYIGRGLCDLHYNRLQSAGKLWPVTVHDLLDRWGRDTESGCREWRGSLDKDGYGKVMHQRVHRAAWERVNGPIPDGLVIDHLCRNRKCYAVSHLEPVTSGENTRRGIPAHILRTGMCGAGHVMDETNTRIYIRPSDGQVKRMCRACAVTATARYRHKKREAA